ncbi:MAG TPA: hypothetical protein ENL34_10885 [Chloroflexi bacterium]|nr:hypothetical protein [Chloroflexota bacterium]
MTDLKVIKPTLVTSARLGGMWIDIYQTQYLAGGLAVIAKVRKTGEPYATISEYHADANLGPGEFVAQTRNLPMHVTMALRELFDATGRYHHFDPFGCVEPIWAMKDVPNECPLCGGLLDEDSYCPQCKHTAVLEDE